MQQHLNKPEFADIELQALADDQISEEERKRRVDAIMTNPEALARLDELLHQNRLLRNWWGFLRKD